MSFIVIDDTKGTAAVLTKEHPEFPGIPKLGILLFSEETATEFPSRVAANRAIQRTASYMDRQSPRRLHHILRVFKLQPEAMAK